MMHVWIIISFTVAAVIAVFWVMRSIYRVFAYIVERERKYMAMLDAVIRLDSTLNPPLVSCSSCKRAIPATPSFRFDGICPYCGTAHDPKSIAQAVGVS